MTLFFTFLQITPHCSNIHRTASYLVTDEYLSVLCSQMADQLEFKIFNKQEPWINIRSAALSYCLPVDLLSFAIHECDGRLLQLADEVCVSCA